MMTLNTGKNVYRFFKFCIVLQLIIGSDSLSDALESSSYLYETTTIIIENELTTDQITSTEDSVSNPVALLNSEITTTASPTSLALVTETVITTTPGTTTTTEPSCVLDHFHDDLTGRQSVAIKGDFTITIITSDGLDAIELIANRINKLGLITENATLGLRAIQILDIGRLTEFFIQELQFQQKCIPESLGTFVDAKFWTIIEPLVESNQFQNIWQLQSTEEILFPMVAHLLYELSWHNQNVSLEVRTLTTDENELFKQLSEKQQFCYKTFPSNDTIFIVIGNEMLKATHFGGDGTIFAVPIGSANMDKSYINDLPDRSFLISETKIELNELNDTLDQLLPSTTLDNGDREISIISTDLIKISKSFLQMVFWLNSSIVKNCGGINYTQCRDPLLDLKFWKNHIFEHNVEETLHILELDTLSGSMNLDLLQKIHVKQVKEFTEMKQIASQNFVTNVSTYFRYTTNETIHREMFKLGHMFSCDNRTENEDHQPIDLSHGEYPVDEMYDKFRMRWQVKPQAWVAAGLTISILGILMSLSILVFIASRVCNEDVLEGNPVCSILLLISLVGLFASFIPYSLEYIGDVSIIDAPSYIVDTWNSLCAVRLFLLTLTYCVTFSILLCRAIMLASIGSEGGFLSHVNGWIQSVICGLSILVQIGLSTQLIVVLHATKNTISCDHIFYGNWLWGIIGYDGFLLIALTFLAPFYFRSQRNYHEGVLIMIGSILTLAVWSAWIPLAMLGPHWREIAVPMGAQITGWAILGGILVPRSFLIVRGIARSDLAKALPSLTSLAFAQSNQYTSEQSVYECVNPAMRQRSYNDDSDPERCPSPSEIPTLPLRGASRGNNMHHIQYSQQQQLGNVSPSKITRF